jgi:alpha-mannosidase
VLKLAAGEAGNVIEVEATIQWQTHERLLKVGFPLTVSNPKATYDLGLGVVQRDTNSQSMHEVPAQGWADITDEDGSYGITVFSDRKYGWDKPSAHKLRLTLLHTPGVAQKSPEQAELDIGRTHKLRYAVAGHEGDWRTRGAVALGQSLNQPLVTAAVAPHDGRLGQSFGFLRTSSDQLTLMSLKKAERSDDIVVRVRETQGTRLSSARIWFAAEIESAVEVDGQEMPVGEAAFTGNAVQFEIGGYQPKAFAVRLRRCPV